MAVSANPAINKNDSTSNVNGASTNNNYVSDGGRFTLCKNSAVDPSDRRLVHNTDIRIDWTPDEQSLVIELLVRYASDSIRIRYGKIAHQLQKSIRDVATFCQGITICQKNLNVKGRDYDNGSSKKQKIKRENFTEQAKSSPHAKKRGISVDIDDVISYKVIGGIPGKLLEQNAHALDQVSVNLSDLKVHDNINLLCQSGNNIITLLKKLNETSEVMKYMPPLPAKLNVELANSILRR